MIAMWGQKSIGHCDVDSIRDVTDGSITKLQGVLKSCIENLDLKKVIKDIWTRALDVDTWISLEETRHCQGQPVGSSADSQGESGSQATRWARWHVRLHKIIWLVFRVSDQYPDVVVGIVYGFILYMLGVATLIAVLQRWDTSW